FLIESGSDGPRPTYRLFHQALNDALIRARAGAGRQIRDEAALATALIEYGVNWGWTEPGGYLLRSLPAHAQRAGLIDELLHDDASLLHADLRRLIPAAEHARTEAGRQRARLLQLTPEAIVAEPAVRAAVFSVTHAMQHLDAAPPNHPASPFRAMWASTPA